MKDGLYEALIAHHERGMLPMHMPGHKRNPAFFGARYPIAIDVTEIDGLDDLHRARGILKECMERAAALYQSERTFYLVGGSTAGILAGIRAATRRGDFVIVARNCHLSVYHALELNGLHPVFVEPMADKELCFFGSIATSSVEAALISHPETSLIVITSPTYEGVLSDIRAISNLAHAHGIPLLVDEAHGAHLGFSKHFPESALHCGADLVVQSLHKTLPSLTQTALLHANSRLVSADAVERELRVFETSSPSYILMASIDDCIRLLESDGPALLTRHAKRLKQFYHETRTLNNLRVFSDESPAIYRRDLSKLIISTLFASVDGGALHQLLLSEHHIQSEMALNEYVLLITSLCDSDEAFETLLFALKEADRESEPRVKKNQIIDIHFSKQVMPIETAVQSPCEFVPVSKCAGRVSGEYVYAYPPGVPILLPGQRIAQAALPMIAALSKGPDGLPVDAVRVVVTR